MILSTICISTAHRYKNLQCSHNHSNQNYNCFAYANSYSLLEIVIAGVSTSNSYSLCTCYHIYSTNDTCVALSICTHITIGTRITLVACAVVLYLCYSLCCIPVVCCILYYMFYYIYHTCQAYSINFLGFTTTSSMILNTNNGTIGIRHAGTYDYTYDYTQCAYSCS